MTSTKCFQAKADQLHAQWYIIDAADQVVGRLAAQIAPILMGKHRPTYTPHIDTGDYVIVINADKVVFTGNKWQQKSYQRFTGYPGGQREEVAWKLFKRRPTRILELAVQRMMPKNKIGRHMLSKLKLYAGAQHPHQAQAPIPLEAVNGRPASSGAVWTPEPKVKSPRPRVEPSAPKPGPVTAPPKPESEAALPSPPPEAALPPSAEGSAPESGS
ncbi:MAG TPA: 50S ribosomal protein L13 [Isosphaeraceae bacterium]|jgi:large subunit ribosomal protein L13|nr:50S ribosomal protein L13 [Isosphaeraceae bacterium]